MKTIKSTNFWLGVAVCLIFVGVFIAITSGLENKVEITYEPEVEFYSEPLTDEEIIVELIDSFSKRLEYVELHTTLDENGVTTIDLKMKLYSRVVQ